jgi:hypothetical protein
MEVILAIIVFGLMAAFCIYGFTRSQRAATEGRGGPFSMTPDRSSGSTGQKSTTSGALGASPGRKTEDHATLSETTRPDGSRKGETSGDIGKQRPQADRPLTSGDVGA